MSSAEPHVVVLVHGTWARGIPPLRLAPEAPWCKDSSSLCKAITKALSPQPVVFDAFPWSGRNSTAARLDAAEHLRERLARLRAQYPHSSIHIVTHSHGGNVAMYCLRNEDARTQVVALVCLSTPFLIVRPRLLDWRMAVKIRFLLLSLLMVMFIASLIMAVRPLLGQTTEQSTQPQKAAKAQEEKGPQSVLPAQYHVQVRSQVRSERETYSSTTTEQNKVAEQVEAELDRIQRETDRLRDARFQKPEPWWHVIPNLILASWFFSLFILALERLGRMLDWLHRWNHRAGRKLSLPQSLPFPVLIIRDTADEASTALGGAQFVSWLTTLGLRWSAAVLPNTDDSWRSSHWMGRLFRICSMLALSGLGLVAASVALQADSLVGVGLWIAGAAAGTFGGLVLLSILTIPLIWLLIVVLGIGMAPFGLRMALGGLSLQMSAEGSPPGPWNVLQISSSPRGLGEGGLRHSTYDSPIALKHLQEWIVGISR